MGLIPQASQAVCWVRVSGLLPEITCQEMMDTHPSSLQTPQNTLQREYHVEMVRTSTVAAKADCLLVTYQLSAFHL